MKIIKSKRSRYRTKKWKALRWKLLQEADFRCKKCGRTGGRLEVDHIVPWRKSEIDFFDKSNLMVLCVSCHSQKTRAENQPKDPRKAAWDKLVNEML